MDTVTRRRFLLASGVSGAAALAAGATTLDWTGLAAATAGHAVGASSGTQPVLVVVTLYGGNDGLSTLIPYEDAAYHDARPDLAYTADEVHQLGDGLGLNPAMTGLATLWSRRQLAVVRGVGYPRPDQSHFRSMDIWQTASPSTPVRSGWIGRWLDASGDDPLRALNIGAVLPPLAVGEHSTAAALDPGRPGALTPTITADLDELGAADAGDSPALAAVRTSYRSERTVSSAVARAMAKAPSTADDGLAGQLSAVSRCIAAGVPTRVYCVSLDGFDTHADEKATQSALLGSLDSAVTGFLAEVAAAGRTDVTVVIYSEFGRRVSANASNGSDHGSAGTVLVAGDAVRGGFHGDQPSLTDLDDGNLKVTTDFRAVYGELLETILDTDPARVLDEVPTALGLLA